MDVYVVRVRQNEEANVLTLSHHASEEGADQAMGRVAAAFPEERWRINGTEYTNPEGGRMWVGTVRVEP